MFHEGDPAQQDTDLNEGGGQEPTQQWVEPNPADYGITLGTNSCLDQCWNDFYQCLKNTTFPEQCIAQLEACKRNCPPVDVGAPDMQPPEAGPL